MRYVHPLLKHFTFGATRRAIRSGEYFVPYFVSNPQFDNTEFTTFLAGSSIAIPRVGSYVNQLLDYCVDSDWGRRPMPLPPHKERACSLPGD